MGLGSPTTIALPCAAHKASLLGWLHILPMTFLGTCPTFLVILSGQGVSEHLLVISVPSSWKIEERFGQNAQK
jgi:hypothetical protein